MIYSQTDYLLINKPKYTDLEYEHCFLYASIKVKIIKVSSL